MKHFILIGLLVLSTSFSLANSYSALDDYIILNAKINGQTVHLAIDTGAEYSLLFSKTAKQLGLNVTAPPKPPKPQRGKVPFSLSDECTFSTDNSPEIKLRFPVIELPPTGSFTPLGGVIGWAQIKNNILWFDVDARQLDGLDKLPDNIDTWSKYDIFDYPKFRVLLITIGEQENKGFVLIDTGNPKGISINARLWKDWSVEQKKQPFTLSAYYTPGIGLKVYEERWAEQLDIGNFKITGVPVSKESIIIEQTFPNFLATLGLFALSRLEVIIDGPGGHVYMRQKKDPTSKYQYNRMAAVFVPENPQSLPLIAHVIQDGPAYKAGLLDGDVLLKIDDLDVTQWQTDPRVLPLSRFWQKPAKTKLVLSLMREDQPLTITVELEDIFP